MSSKVSAINTAEPAGLHDLARKVFGGLAARDGFLDQAGFMEARAGEQYVFDADGRRYLDCHTSAGAFNLGRANPDLQEQLKNAARELDQGNFVMVSAEKARLANKLAQFMPGTLECSLFTVVRGEAFDAACKLARGFTGRPELVSVEGGWHGQTGFAASLSHGCGQYAHAPQLPGTKTVALDDQDKVKQQVNGRTAAVIFEPVQAENHCRAINKATAQYLRKLCDAVGALLIVDETQTGFGRTGRKFAFEGLGIQPDIALLGEALSGGMFPMTAMVFTKRVKSFFDAHPLIHLCTFGGHDVGCRVACRALELYEAQKPWQNAAEREGQLGDGLRRLASAHGDIVESVRGRGLLWSLRTTSPEQADGLCRSALQNNVLAMPGRVDAATVLIRPPLTITKDQIDALVEALGSALAGMTR